MKFLRLTNRDFSITINRFFSNSIFAFQQSNREYLQNSNMAKVTERSNSGDIACLEDIEPPFGKFLSGRYKRYVRFITCKHKSKQVITLV